MSESIIRLFVSDIDGCLSEPYRPYDLDGFARLARFAASGGSTDSPGGVPSLSICSGRAYPYVEAVTQVLGIRVPVLFESGGGMFDPLEARVFWNPRFTEDVAKKIEEVRHWMIRECLPGSSLMYDYGKRTQAGIIGPDERDVIHILPRVEAFVSSSFPELHVFHTPVSIDVAAPGITKRQAMHWLAEVTGIKTGEMAFIGDTNGDIGAMEEVGYPLAPANATPSVKALAKLVASGKVIEGVLEAYQWCLDHNKKLQSEFV